MLNENVLLNQDEEVLKQIYTFKCIKCIKMKNFVKILF